VRCLDSLVPGRPHMSIFQARNESRVERNRNKRDLTVVFSINRPDLRFESWAFRVRFEGSSRADQMIGAAYEACRCNFLDATGLL
jgi:hypothetical protein